jgi:3-hydroxyisobutyrate dehydrogenase-like beta-hydroxyacid dehydrogenase
MAAHGVPALATALVQQLVHAQVTAGGGEDDYSGVAKVVFQLAGLA